MPPKDVRTMVTLIRQLVEFEAKESSKIEMIECEASDQDLLAIHEFCSWFFEEEPEAQPEGASS